MRLLAPAADDSEPDWRQAVKAGAVAPPLRGLGLDCLTPPGVSPPSRQRQIESTVALPIRNGMQRRGGKKFPQTKCRF
jgi:hypothetical protein